MELIRFVGFGFSLLVPAGWARLATPRHLAVFAGDGRSFMAVSSLEVSPREAARMAASDHAQRFDSLEILREVEKPPDVYRRYRRLNGAGGFVLEHQLFRPCLLLTCSRVELPQTEGDEEVFRIGLLSLAGRRRPEDEK